MIITGRDFIKAVIESELLDSPMVIWHQEKGRQKIVGINVNGDPETDEIEIITDGLCE